MARGAEVACVCGITIAVVDADDNESGGAAGASAHEHVSRVGTAQRSRGVAMGAQYDYGVAEESYGVAHDYGHAQSHAHAHASTYTNMNMNTNTDSATAMYTDTDTDAGTARAGSQTSTSKTDSVDRLVTSVQYLLLNTVDSLTRTL